VNAQTASSANFANGSSFAMLASAASIRTRIITDTSTTLALACVVRAYS